MEEAARSERRSGRDAPLPPSSPAPDRRRPLPTRAAAAPPLPPAFSTALDALLPALAVALTAGARAGIDAHARLLLAWTGAINLTAIRDPASVALEHVADSLAAVPLLRAVPRAPRSLLDIGSGGGYPGLPLAVALPVESAVLLDSIAKKARFLTVAADAAAAAMAAAGEVAPVINAEASRAEALAASRERREAFDVVTARAVGRLAEVVELALPLAGFGGRLVAWKRDDGRGALATEIRDAERLVSELGGRIESVEAVTVPGLEDHRLVVVAKRAATPKRFPRPPAARRAGGATSP